MAGRCPGKPCFTGNDGANSQLTLPVLRVIGQVAGIILSRRGRTAYMLSTSTPAPNAFLYEQLTAQKRIRDSNAGMLEPYSFEVTAAAG